MNDTEDRDQKISQWRDDAAGLSYEEALQALDLVLSELQNDSVPLAALQMTILHGEVYLDRCSTLLETVEQSVVQLDPDTLTPNDDA